MGARPPRAAPAAQRHPLGLGDRPKGTRLRFRYLAENGHWFNDPDVADRDGADNVLLV